MYVNVMETRVQKEVRDLSRVLPLARGPALKNLSRPKVEWGLICSPVH